VTLLGTALENGAHVQLPPTGRAQGTYVVGLNGTGKTTMLVNIALSDMARGDGLCVLDPHGDMTEDLLARVPKDREQDVIVFDPSERPGPSTC
jgi:ABC-type branched-subunit amino acid transport system ATPase component